MRATDELRNDHETLRETLAQLEERLPILQAAPHTLLNLTRTIARRLHAHTDKEEQLVAAFHARRHGKPHVATSLLSDEHEDQQQTLARLLELLTEGNGCPVDEVETYATHLIDALREHMVKEEAGLFPLADRALGSAQRESEVLDAGD